MTTVEALQAIEAAIRSSNPNAELLRIREALTSTVAGDEGMKQSLRALGLGISGAAAFPDPNDAAVQAKALAALRQQEALLVQIQKLVAAIEKLQPPANPEKEKEKDKKE